VTASRTYLDYNASAPLLPEARAAMVAALDACGNPSSVHGEGRRARALVDAAREEVAALVNARPSEIVFTSGATEANTWAMTAAWSAIIASGVEHDSVREPAMRSGARFVTMATSPGGVANVATIADASQPARSAGRSVVALQMANNETGVVQPLSEAVTIARETGHAVHTDAVQAAGRIAIDFRGLGVETMSLSSHKIGGPKGVGALVVRDGATLPPLVSGGGQERYRRAGTENVAGIAGFGAAARVAAERIGEMHHVAALRDRFEREVMRLTPEAVIVGASAPRLPNTTCVALPGRSAETLVIKLDLAGVAVSAGAACSSGKVSESRVLIAMGLSPALAKSAIRVSIGSATTEQDIAAFLAAWKAIRGDARAAA
jgi:cysteine desulfurase